MDSLEQALQDLQKQMQKIRIMARGFSRNYTSDNHAEKVTTDKKTEVKQVNSTLTTSSYLFADSVKGAFGKKLTTTLDNQKQLLKTL